MLHLHPPSAERPTGRVNPLLSTTISKRSVKKAIILPVPTQAIHLGGFFGEKPEIEIGKSRKAPIFF